MKLILALLASAMLVGCHPETISIARRELSGVDTEDSDAASEDEGDAALDGGARDAGPEGEDAPADGACKTLDECGEGSYCDKQQRAAPYGTCEARPTVCPPTQDPVCGSDEISYFNDCIRKQNGIAFATSGECGRNARPCGDIFTPSACPLGTFCGRLKVTAPDDLALLCAFDIVATPGKCWALPDCSTVPPGGGRWIPCLPPVSAALGGGTPGSGEPGSGAGGGSFGGGSGGGFGGTAGPTCINTCRAIESEQVHIAVTTCTR
jgi:hypothetical protein